MTPVESMFGLGWNFFLSLDFSVLVTFLVAMIKYLTKNNLRKSFFGVTDSGLQSIMAVKAWQESQGAAGYIVSATRK